MRDKLVERDRYDESNHRVLARISNSQLCLVGAASVPLALRRPYEDYEARITRHVRPGARILDLCAGNGVHSFAGVRAGGHCTALDISAASLEVAARRAAALKLELSCVVSDAEVLPFPDDSFDLVTCAGSLSYVDIATLAAEVRRVLKPGGKLIGVDSFNHNPFYRANRYLQYLRGKRTRSTLQRMPNRRTLEFLSGKFRGLQVVYHGVFVFLLPLVRLLMGPSRAARWIARSDEVLPFLRRYSFKIVYEATNEKT